MIIAMNCNLCGTSRYVLVYRKPAYAEKKADSSARYAISESHLEKPDKIVRCVACGLVFAIPDSSISEITKDYEHMADEEYVAEEKGRREQARRVLSKIEKFKARGRLLDVGCGPGLLLDEARRRGWQVRGADLSSWSRDYAKTHFGIDIFLGSLSSARFPDRHFDAIVMNDVIEHLEDPKAALEEIRRILKNDGVLYVSTPDISSFLSRLLGGRWWGVNKYHLYYYSHKTLEQLFGVVGFRRLGYFSYPRVFSLNYWAKRLEPYPAFVCKPIRWLAGIGNIGQKLLTVDLHDQIGVIVRKVQRFDSLFEEDRGLPEGAPVKKKVIAVLPAYNAERTLERTVRDIPRDVVDEIILVDDKSGDRTVEIAKRLGLIVFEHPQNRGYGGNQKTCYEKAMERGADVVVMVHPDYQYDPKIIPQMVEPIVKGQADAVFGSRMMKGGALDGGMPLWKHNANILLTAFENVMLGTYLTEYHSGFRAYSTDLLKEIRYRENSDGFIFDTQIIVQIIAAHKKIEEIPIRTRYFEGASSIRLWPSILYGLGILWEMLTFLLHRQGILRNKRLDLVD